MAGNKFNRLNKKTPDEPVKPTNQQTNKPINQQVVEPTNPLPSKQSFDLVFAPSFNKLPEGSGIHLGIESLRPLLIQVGKEQRSFSIHQQEKDALDRATFLLKMQGLKADANKLLRASLTRALADLDEKGKDSFLFQMIDNLSN